MNNSINFDMIIDAVKDTKNIVLNKELKKDINIKGEANFVSAVDIEISNFLKNRLHLLTPEIGFMSEEENNKIQSSRWILDPIDGTTNLIYNYNMCSVSLALCIGEIIDFGVVFNPFNDDIFVAYRGKGAYFNGKRITDAPDRDINKCLIEFGAGSTRKYQADTAFSIAKDVFCNCLDLRRICSSALSICYIAVGRINGYFEKELKPWDYAAASLILEECVGIITDWNGDKISYKEPSSIICGTQKAYNFLLKTINNSNNN